MLVQYLLPLAVLAASTAQADYTINVVNNCDEVVYAGAGETKAGFVMDPNPPSDAQFIAGRIDAQYHGSGALKKGDSWLIKPKAQWIGGRVWARTGCQGEGESMTCQTGECIGGQFCTEPYVGGLGAPHDATLSEFGFGHHEPAKNRVFINLSRNQGWNIGVSITGGTRPVSCPDQNCSTNQAYGLTDPSNSSSEFDADAGSAQLVVTFCPGPAPSKLKARRTIAF